MSPTFVDALSAAHEGRVAKRSKLAKALMPPSSKAWLGAVLLDAMGWEPHWLLDSSSLITCDDIDGVDAVRELLRVLFGDALSHVGRYEVVEGGVGIALIDTSSSEDLYDQAVTSGAPIVILASGVRKILPPEAAALATRRVAVPSAPSADVVERLVAVVSGDAVQVSRASAARMSMIDLLRCVPLGTTGEQAKERFRKLIAHRDGQDKVIADAKATPDAAVPVGAVPHDVVRRLSQMSGFGDAGVWGINAARDLVAYADGTIPWADVDKGLLLSGPPGGGKTTFARAFAAECSAVAGREVPLVVTTYTEWSAAGGRIGDSMSKGLTKLFDAWRKQAAEKGPFILFLDEVDSMGRRGGNAQNESWFGPVINSWLAFLDGAVSREGIIVVAATNHPERVDPAMLRPGRLDRHLELPMPDVAAMAGIVRAHLGADAMLTDDELAEAARGTGTQSCRAEVGQLARGARWVARWCHRRVCASDLTDAVALLRGPVDPVADRMVAVHEAGHAVAVACAVLGVDRLEWVDQDLGVTRMRLSGHWMESVVLGRLRTILAARAAEEVLLGRTSTGAERDLRDVTDLAVAYQSAWGWGVTGCVSVGRERAVSGVRTSPSCTSTVSG